MHSTSLKNILKNPELNFDQPIILDTISQQILPSIRDCLVMIHNRLERAHEYNDKNDVCFCLEPLDQAYETSTISTPLCDHTSHKHCLDSWMNTGQLTCPTCRKKVSEETINNEILPRGINQNLLGYIKQYSPSIAQLRELMLAADNLGIDPLLNICDGVFGFEATKESVQALRTFIDESSGQREKIAHMILMSLCNKTNLEFKDLDPEEKERHSIQELQALFEKSVNYKTRKQLITEQMDKVMTFVSACSDRILLLTPMLSGCFLTVYIFLVLGNTMPQNHWELTLPLLCFFVMPAALVYRSGIMKIQSFCGIWALSCMATADYFQDWTRVSVGLNVLRDVRNKTLGF